MPRFDITIAGELNLDLIFYGLPLELPPERELLAERMMLTLAVLPESSHTTSRLWEAGWDLSRLLETTRSAKLRCSGL